MGKLRKIRARERNSQYRDGSVADVIGDGVLGVVVGSSGSWGSWWVVVGRGG